MNSEKATAVSPSSSPRARGRPAGKRNGGDGPILSPCAAAGSVRACMRGHNHRYRFYTVFSPVVRKSHTCSFKKEATSLPARRQLKTYNYNKGFPPDSSRLGKVFPLDGRHIRGDPDRP